MSAVRIPLTHLPRILRARKPTKHTPSYREAYVGILDGRVPAEQDSNCRWTIDESDLPLIADALCKDIKTAA